MHKLVYCGTENTKWIYPDIAMLRTATISGATAQLAPTNAVLLQGIILLDYIVAIESAEI